MKMSEFPKEINLFRLEFDREKKIYKYDEIPPNESENNFTKRGNKFFSLEKIGNPDEVEFKPYLVRKLIENDFRNNLSNRSYDFKDRYTAYKDANKIPHNRQNEDIFSMFKGFEYRFIPIIDDMFLCIDYKLTIKFNASIQDLLDLNAPERLLIDRSVEFMDVDEQKLNGRLIRIENSDDCVINLYGDNAGPFSVPASELYLLCRPEVIQHILKEIGKPENVIALQRQHSLLNPKRRLAEIKKVVKTLNDEDIFPLLIEGLGITLDAEPLPIEDVGYSTFYDSVTLKCEVIPMEPELQFGKGFSNVKPVPTRYPPYTIISDLSLALYYPKTKETNMNTLFTGLERYLKDYFYVDGIKASKHSIEYEPVDQRYNDTIQSSVKFGNKVDLGLIYVPENMKYYSNSPYYTLKSYFASQGIPTQMVTDKAFAPSNYPLNYTWLNICTAITAKCGGVPWALKTKLKETDIVIGMSLSARLSNIGENIQRNRYIGFANIFNEYGKWLYFFGTAHKYSRDQSIEQVTAIIKETKDYYLRNNHVVPKNIIIHNSKRSKWQHREKLYGILKKNFGEDVKAAFVTIDESHNYRCFDSSSQDGSLPRGNFIYLNDRELLLSTTGASSLSGSYRHGTPKVLHIIAHQYPEKFLSLADVAYQVLALTKLNWASVSPAQREPATIKYANRIAKIAANIGSQHWNEIGDQLFNKPWFI
jgi:hypothetical protein